MNFSRLIYGEFADLSNRAAGPDKSLAMQMFSIILKVEKTIGCGCLVCVNAIIFNLLVLPISSLLHRRSHAYLRMLLLLTVTMLLNYFFPSSRLYHDLRQQDFIKITAAYNMLNIADRILSNFGCKVIQATFAYSPPKHPGCACYGDYGI